MDDHQPLPYGVAGPALIRCVARTASLLARRRIHLPSKHVGMRLRYCDAATPK